MFYPVDSLRRGGRFYLCWVADSWPLRFATITHRQLWSQDIREICNDLLEVMKNESGRPTNRFSLRLSSQLLRGLVRLYQRKVTVFVGDLCMINAHVMKSTHKNSRPNFEESERIIKSLELPRLYLEIHPDEEKVEEKIQTSGNIVAHIEDITLREPTLPENRILLDDGFGELNTDQPIQVMLGDRSVEMMLYKESSAQLSDLPLDFSIEQSHDKSRLNPRPLLMERLSEHDISVFGKSMGEGMLLGDLEKEIPEIPDLPHSDPPHTDKVLEKDEHKGKESEKSKLLTPDEIVLEELEEEPQAKRRKLKNKLIIDKKIKLNSDYIRSRIGNNEVETRREVLAPPPRWCVCLVSQSARPLGAGLAALRWNTLQRLHADTQEAVLQRKRNSGMRTILEKIDEEVEAVEKYDGNLELEHGPRQMDVTSANVLTSRETLEEAMNMEDLPTQKLLETPHTKKRASEEEQPPKRRCSGFISFGHSRRQTLELSTAEANKENIPQACNPSERLTALLQRHGLADCELAGGWEEGPPGGAACHRGGSQASETPLGSLDRTKVSLGDSDNTTDSKKFIREEWGTQGAMHKIYRCIKAGASPLDMERLMASGPLLAGHRRVIAARCFASILKLKQHGFIRILKDSKTYEIKDISLGSKIIQEK